MKQLHLFIFISGAFILSQAGSCGGVSIKEADKAKSKNEYKYAADIYTKASTNSKLSDEEATRAREEAAYCYKMANEYDKAIKAYERILKKDSHNTTSLYNLGVLKMKVAGENNPDELKDARYLLAKYLKDVPNDARATTLIAGIDSAESWRGQKNRFVVTNLKSMNTRYNEFAPMIGSKRDDVLYVSSDRAEGKKDKIWGGYGNPYSDIWFAKEKKVKKSKTTAGAAQVKNWDKPIRAFGAINGKLNDGVCAFDRRYSTIYYTNCDGYDAKKPTLSCKIYVAELKGVEWNEPQMLEFCAADSFNYGHPTLSDDGNKLYFTSDREGGYGGYDVWVVIYNKRGKTWGEPINLGPSINTAYNEYYPYWNTHDQMLYFSSNGHIGMGGLDIYRCEGDGTEWSEPENLRHPLNSGGDDFGITFDVNRKDHGYFTSNREGGRGSDDIYEFDITPLVLDLEGYVYACVVNSDVFDFDKPLINSTVLITNDRDSNVIELVTDEKGYYHTMLDEKTAYEIKAMNRDLYYFDAEPAQKSTRGIKVSTTLRQDFCLQSQIIDVIVPIFYDLDKDKIRPDAARVLMDTILPLMEKYPKLRMELGSHTDCRNSYEYNMDLSRRRADSAVAFLVSQGIDKRRLVAKGYGESRLTNDCPCEGAVKSNCSDAQHQANRRTTFKTLDVNWDPKTAPLIDEVGQNVNEAPIILKMTKKGSMNTILVVGNGMESTTNSIIGTGSDMVISTVELKALLAKGAVKMTEVSGMTMGDITGNRIKPNSTVKLTTLRIGEKDRGKTLDDVTLKIGNVPAPYQLGADALIKRGAKINVEELEINFSNINDSALVGGQPVESKILEETPPVIVDTLSLESYSATNLTTEGSKSFVATMVNDKENVNWEVDLAGNKTMVTEEVVKTLLESGALSKNDFEPGEKIKLEDGTKLKSNIFIIAKLEIGDIVIENVRVTVSNKADVPVLGKSVLRKYQPIIKYGKLFMKDKKKK